MLQDHRPVNSKKAIPTLTKSPQSKIRVGGERQVVVIGETNHRSSEGPVNPNDLLCQFFFTVRSGSLLINH
jgi:hypothetical protein